MAILTAAFDSNKTAIKAVIVVPILAPMINGVTLLKRIVFVATKGTTIEVVIELLCAAAVIPNPHANDLYGLSKMKLLIFSCDGPIISLEIMLDKNFIDPNRSPNAPMIPMKLLPIIDMAEFPSEFLVETLTGVELERSTEPSSCDVISFAPQDTIP